MQMKESKHLSFKDGLTGLYNRRYLDIQINRLANSRQMPLSVIVISLDKLKELNNKFGHSTGDKYIKLAAKILKDIFRSEDLLARISGNEFAVLLPETDEKISESICERIKDNFKRAENEEYFPIGFSISIGTSIMNAQDNELISYYKNKEKNLNPD